MNLLTAEQVRKVLFDHLSLKCRDREYQTDVCQAIADELNAMLSSNEKTNMNFVVYAGYVAKDLYDEAFALLEGCDEPDFSAINAICRICIDMMQITNMWQRTNKKKAVK